MLGEMLALERHSMQRGRNDICIEKSRSQKSKAKIMVTPINKENRGDPIGAQQ